MKKKAQFIYDYLKVISLIDTCVLLSEINLYNLTCFFFFWEGEYNLWSRRKKYTNIQIVKILKINSLLIQGYLKTQIIVKSYKCEEEN